MREPKTIGYINSLLLKHSGNGGEGGWEGGGGVFEGVLSRIFPDDVPESRQGGQQQ